MQTTQELYHQAQQFQQAGQLAKAWDYYQAILKQQPQHLPTLTSMANLLYKQKEYQRAVEIYQHLTTFDLLNADIWYRCGMTYAKLEDKKAIDCFRKVLKIHPKSAEKVRLTVLLQLAKALKNAKQHPEAKKIAERLVAKDPKNASALSVLAQIAQVDKEEEKAYALFQQVIAFVPENAAAHLNMGTSCMVLKKLEAAAKHLEKARLLRPNWAEAYRELGICYQHQGHTDKALSFLKQALKIKPKDKENYRKIANFYRTQGDYKTSVLYDKKLSELAPDDKDAQYNIGLAHSILGNAAGSLPYFQKAYELEAEAQTAFALGNTFNSLQDPDKSDYWFNKTIAHQPDHYSAIYNLILRKMEYCDWSNRAADVARLIATLEEHLQSEHYELSLPALFLNYIDLPMPLHLKMNQYIEQGSKKRIDLLKKQVNFVHQPRNRKQLHIGYTSPDFRDHPVGRLVAELFEHHDREKVKVFTYFLTPYEANNEYAQRIKAGSDVSREFAFISTIDAAKQIYADEIDILIDLAGHTASNRIDILALQPAPIQAHCIGFPDTMGMSSIQYILADKYLAPKHLADFYTEEIVHLPSCFISPRPKLSASPLSRVEVGLPEDVFVFVGFNRPAKIEPELFACWLAILKAVDNSVLWLSDFLPKARKNLLQTVKEAGIAPERIIFSEKRPYPIYLKSHQLADLFLDTWHYSAGSTAIAALGAGLPVLTCMADNNAARMGASIVAAAGLEELICEDLESYQRKAIELAQNPSVLEKYKLQLRQPAEEILLFNNQQFVQNLESTFEQLWSKWKKEET